MARRSKCSFKILKDKYGLKSLSPTAITAVTATWKPGETDRRMRIRMWDCRAGALESVAEAAAGTRGIWVPESVAGP